MPYVDDEARREARARLQARMDRRAAAGGSSHTERRQRSEYQGRPARSQRPSQQERMTASRRMADRQRETQRSRGYATTSSRSSRPSTSPTLLETIMGTLESISERLPVKVPPLALLIAAIILIILIVFAMTNVTRCAAPAPQQQAQTQQAQTAASQSQSAQTATADVDSASKEELVKIIGEDEADKLLDTAKTNKEALWIASHAGSYNFDGEEVQEKILKLAADEPEAIAFVRSFPSQYPSANIKKDESLAMSTGSPSSDVPETKIPHLYQWDRRWGNTVYSSAAFGLTACGPTSLAMVYQGLTGSTDKNPYDFGVLAEERGYMAQYDGTANGFFTDLAPELGLKCEQINVTSDSVKDALKSGAVIIANLGPGSFSENGHFFVLAGMDGDDKVIVNDPYSYERSSKTWDVDDIVSESLALYSYTQA